MGAIAGGARSGGCADVVALDMLIAALSMGTVLLLLVSITLLALAQRRSRSTLFSDAAWKAAALVAVTIWLGYVADHAEALGGDAAWYRVAEVVGHLLIATFFLLLSTYLWRFAQRGSDLVVVSPEFLVGVRNRTRAMYGAGPARFISYAVGKDSAREAIRRHVGAGLVTPRRVWKRLPHLFRLLGYGRLRVLDAVPRERMRVEVRESFETMQPAKEAGCDLTRGYLAGLGEALEPGFSCEVEEVRCGARHGEERCEFAIRWFPQEDAATVEVARASSETTA